MHVVFAPGAIVASRRSSSDRPITLVTSAPWKAVARLVCSERPITDTTRTRSPVLTSVKGDPDAGHLQGGDDGDPDADRGER